MKKTNFTFRLFLALGLLIAIILALWFGFSLLKNFISKSFTLDASIENINKEIQNSVKSKNLIAENKENLFFLSTHRILGETDIPFAIEEIEDYTQDLDLPLVVNSIDFVDKESGNKSLSIYLSSYGDFGSLIKLIQLFENSSFIFSIDVYSLKQVFVLPLNTTDSTPVFREVSGGDQGTSANKTWLLNVKLTIDIKT